MDYVFLNECEHCVYLLWGDIGGKFCVKVGYSSFLGDRIETLATSVPFELRAGYVLRAGGRGKAFAVEQYLHERLSKHRTVGEWFVFDDELAGRLMLDAITQVVAIDADMVRILADVPAMVRFYRDEKSRRSKAKRDAKKQRENSSVNEALKKVPSSLHREFKRLKLDKALKDFAKQHQDEVEDNFERLKRSMHQRT